MGKRIAHYTVRIADMICEHIALGATLEKALAKVGYLAPTETQVWKWLDQHEEFRAKYERARQLQADKLADKTLELVEKVIADPKATAAYRLAFDVYQYHSSIRNPKVYNKSNNTGDKAPPLDAAKIKTEIKRLERELGVRETLDGKKTPTKVVVPLKRVE